jgi:hypothetical protein
MGLDASTDALLCGVSRESNASKGFWCQLLVPQYCNGRQYLRDCRWYRSYWMEVVPRVYWLDRIRGKSFSTHAQDNLKLTMHVQMVTIYFFFVETAGKTLEEMSEIFEAKNPVKKSLEKTRVIVDDSGRVMSVAGDHGTA